MARTLYYWFVNYPQVLKVVLDNFLKMMANLRQRSSNELAQSEKLIEKATALNSGEGADLTVTEQAQLLNLRKVLSRLENSQNHLLGSILVLQHFK